MGIQLYSYWRSSCSWRIRWALQHKEIPFEYKAINLLKNEQNSTEYLKLNCSAKVPLLVDQKIQLSESIAIAEYLEELYPDKPLLPKDPVQKAKCRELMQIVASNIQPLQNLATMRKHSTDKEEQKAWNVFWISKGLKAFDLKSQSLRQSFSVGETLSLADLFLIPQLYNAKRFEIDLDSISPFFNKLYSRTSLLDSFKASCPEQQIDAVNT